VLKALLTKDYIDNLVPPKNGEVWIADTQIRGFGLRLYATGESSFCIRSKDLSGNAVRRTFNPYRDTENWYLRKWYDDNFDPWSTSSYISDVCDFNAYGTEWVSCLKE